MQELVKFLLDRLLALWPVARINDWQLALLVRGGKVLRELAPGLRLRVPLLDEVKTYPATEVSLDLEASTVETADGAAYTISANVSYRMVSIRSNLLTVWNVETSLACVARGRLASFIARVAAADLNGGRAGIEEQLRLDLGAELASWGIEVTRLHLTDCVRGRALRIYHDGAMRREAA
jgi:hypothetical protein